MIMKAHRDGLNVWRPRIWIQKGPEPNDYTSRLFKPPEIGPDEYVWRALHYDISYYMGTVANYTLAQVIEVYLAHLYGLGWQFSRFPY